VILVDTSVWVDHLRSRNATLAGLLDAGMVLGHPFVIGELALGNLRQRARVLSALQDLPSAAVATDAETLHFIERNEVFGLGIGYVDAHLLAAARLTAGASLWTYDNRLQEAARSLDLAMPSAG
jgi:predicted nucleic acid-binding protein